MTTLTAVAPSGGVPAAAGWFGAVCTPAPSGSMVAISRTDENGNVKVADTALIYNTDPRFPIPAGTLCTLMRTPNGHYAITQAPGANLWPVPGLGGKVIPDVGGWNPGDQWWLGNIKF